MRHLHLYVGDVLDILERGDDCARSARSEGIIERCLRLRGGIRKVVVLRCIRRWSGEELWLIIHVGELHGK